MGRFIIKHIESDKPQFKMAFKKNNIEENKTVMTTDEKIKMAQNVLSGNASTKKIKKDKGLIERAESTKTILTEDNKELLND